MLPVNVKQNITTNYCTLYRYKELYDELFDIVDRHNGKTYFIFKSLVEHFGQIVSSNSCSCRGELVEDHNWSLLDEINKKHLIKIQKKKRYSEYGDLCVTFTVYR